MADKTDGIDPNRPEGTRSPKLGDDDIRKLARAVIEVLEVDHYMGSDGGAGSGHVDEGAGEHLVITLRETTTPAAVAANKGQLFTKVVGDVAELHYIDENEEAKQITSGGNLKVVNADIGTDAVDTAQIAADAVENDQIAADAVDSDEIATGAIDLDHLHADLKHDPTDDVGEESVTLPNGTIIKSGSISGLSGTTTDTVTFGGGTPLPFPGGIKAVILTDVRATTVDWCAIVTAKSVDSFTYLIQEQTTGLEWLAIGY